MALYDSQLLGLIDHVADHLMHFGVYPGEHEFENGYVFELPEILAALDEQAPAFSRFCTDYLKNLEE